MENLDKVDCHEGHCISFSAFPSSDALGGVDGEESEKAVVTRSSSMCHQ